MAPPFLVKRLIESEKKGRYCFSENDKVVLKEMLNEINRVGKYREKIKYLSEALEANPWDSGPIAVKYIEQFDSELARAEIAKFLTHPQVNYIDKKDLDKYYFKLYMHFKKSLEKGSDYPGYELYYIANIYDNKLYKSNSKTLAREIVKLISEPIELYSLSLTLQRIARKWGLPETEIYPYEYLTTHPITKESLGLDSLDRLPHKCDEAIKDVKLYSLFCLSNHPSKKNLDLLLQYSQNEDPIFRDTTNEYLNRLKENAKKQEIIL